MDGNVKPATLKPETCPPGSQPLWNLKLKNNTYMMKTKRLYQSPTTRRDVVELEDGFCGSITNDAGLGQTIKSNTQGYESFDASQGGVFNMGTDANNNECIDWQ